MGRVCLPTAISAALRGRSPCQHERSAFGLWEWQKRLSRIVGTARALPFWCSFARADIRRRPCPGQRSRGAPAAQRDARPRCMSGEMSRNRAPARFCKPVAHPHSLDPLERGVMFAFNFLGADRRSALQLSSQASATSAAPAASKYPAVQAAATLHTRNRSSAQRLKPSTERPRRLRPYYGKS